MKTVVVKVFNKKGVVEEVVATTKSGELTLLQARENVNYELVDEQTGKAPDHILTKRVKDNLLISFEKEGKKAELVIENFYQFSDKEALIGVAENGSYHYYIPDTGEVSDYVGNLKAGEIEGQALGKESLDSPQWSGGWSMSDLSLPEMSMPSFGNMGIVKWLAIGAGIIASVPLIRYIKDKVSDKDDDNVIGDDSAETISTGKGDDFIDGKGGSDSIDAGKDDDTIVYDVKDSKIDGGADFDTLKFIDTGVINLNNAIKNIEKFDFTDKASQELKISASDVLAVTDSDNELFIAGDKTDKLTLEGFAKADSSDHTGYDMYTASGATVYVDDDILATNIHLI